MLSEDASIKVMADIEPLKNSLREIETLFSNLDRVVGKHASSISNTLAKIIGSNIARGQRTSSLERLATPILQQAISSILGTMNQNTAASNQQPVSIAMNIATPDVNSFRMSQGQILAEAAAAIARATRRYS